MSDAEKWANPTEAEKAKDWVILKLRRSGPIPTGDLAAAATKEGIARTTLEVAKRKLKDEGAITIRRYGARTSPFIVELVIEVVGE